MDSYSEVRRVRNQMSQQAGHDIRTLIEMINQRWPDEAARAIAPGVKAEQCAEKAAPEAAVLRKGETPAAR